MDMGKQDLAIENLKKALDINPNIWQSHLILAVIYHQNKQYDLALSECQSAYQLQPNEIHRSVPYGYRLSGYGR